MLCNPACVSFSSSWILPVSGLQHIFHLLHCKYTKVNLYCVVKYERTVCIYSFSIKASAPDLYLRQQIHSLYLSHLLFCHRTKLISNRALLERV